MFPRVNESYEAPSTAEALLRLRNIPIFSESNPSLSTEYIYHVRPTIWWAVRQPLPEDFCLVFHRNTFGSMTKKEFWLQGTVGDVVETVVHSVFDQFRAYEYDAFLYKVDWEGTCLHVYACLAEREE